jgi:CRISPR-associated protein Cas6
MSQTPQPVCEVVDVVFPLDGKFLARDHAQVLHDALAAQWPLLLAQPLTGVHAIKLVSGLGEQALLSRRARLLLRVPLAWAESLLAVEALELPINGQTLHLGAPHLRELQAHATLYASQVAASSADESDFMTEVNRELAVLGIAGERVCGKHHQVRFNEGVVNTFSLMLHGLAPEQSLRLQAQGIGRYRLLGCGLFIPHKSAAAV